MTRKSKTKRRKKPKVSLATVLFIFVIISIVAVAIAYFYFDIGKPKSHSANNSVKTTANTATKHIAAKSVLDGTWVSTTDGRMLEIHGTAFSMELPSVSEHGVTKGSITISGNVATIIYFGTRDKCAENPGTYSFIIRKGSIHFAVRHDNCPGRKLIFATTWDKF